MMQKQVDYKYALFSSQMELATQEHTQRFESKKQEMQAYMEHAHIELQGHIKKLRQERADLVLECSTY